MKLIIQPDDGLTPIVQAIQRAKRAIDIVIFRFDRGEMEKALANAVAKGVLVRALIAHTNRGGEKNLRKLELRLLEHGVTVARTADDLARHHGKMMIADDVLHVFCFNYTKLDMEKSRSFGIATRNASLVKAARDLFEADTMRQPYTASHQRLVVSPENSRKLLTKFIKGAKRHLAIYDDKVTDKLMLRVLQDRLKAGVEIRIIGKKIDKKLDGVEMRKLTDLRSHLRAIVRDGSQAFMGSQSLRKLELDGRRELGVIITDSRIARKIQSVFEADWAQAAPKKSAKEEDRKDAGATEPQAAAAK